MSGRGDPLLAGVDFGTTHIRALVFAPDGTLVAEGGAPTPIDHPRPGWAQHDPEALWRCAATALKQATGRLDDPRAIAGLAVASVGEAGVPLDADDRPTHPVIAWYDTRAQAECDWLTATLGADRVAAVTGCAPAPIFGLCKLLWLKRNEPDAYRRTVRWLNVADFLAWRLCGVAATDFSLAARTLAVDLGRMCWADDLVRGVGIDPALFQPLAVNGTRLGTVTPAAAVATGLPEHCVVGVGGHDHIVGALAAGAWQTGTLLNSLGTAEAVLLALDRPVAEPALSRNGYVQGAMMLDTPHYYLAAASFTCGASADWLHAVVGEDLPYETLIAEAAAVPAGSHGVHFLPTLRVGNPPHPDPTARGAFIGLFPEAGRDVLYRAVLEALAYESRQILDGMLAAADVPPIDRLRAIGGLSRNRLLIEIKATVFERPITVVEIAESTSLGAAILGGLAAGVYPDIDTALDGLDVGEHTVAPDPAMAPGYDRRYSEIYCRLHGAAVGLHQAIERIESEV